MTDLAIIHATVMRSDADGVRFETGRTILIDDGAITAIQPDTTPPPSATETIDAAGQIALPGLINTHTHSPMVMFRGAAEDVSDHAWFNDHIWPMEVNLTDSDIELGAQLAAAEMIASGTTTFADHYFGMYQIARSTEIAGLRAVLGPTYFSTDGPAGLERALAFVDEWNGGAGGRISAALAPHATYTVTDEDLAATARVALDHDLLVHIHAAESRQQTKSSLEKQGATPIGILARTGLLEADVLIAHGIGILPEDIPLLAAGPGRAAVGSAPKGYMKFALDTTPIRGLVAGGIPVGLATDGAASNNTMDLWESMTLTALIQKHTERDEAWLTARQALDHATRQGALALRLEDRIGRLEPGYRADVILVDLSGPHTQPIHDLPATLVFSARSADVTTTIVDGHVLMRDRTILTIDVPALAAELQQRLPRLTDTSHGRTIQNYAP